jgi:hypothetical protein
MTMTARTGYYVAKQGRQWAVYFNGQLIEGGFFDRQWADKALANLTERPVAAAEGR